MENHLTKNYCVLAWIGPANSLAGRTVADHWFSDDQVLFLIAPSTNQQVVVIHLQSV